MCHYELNLDSIPKPEDVHIDTLVYYQLGDEWRQGIITSIKSSDDGQTKYYYGESLSNELVIDNLKTFEYKVYENI